MDDNSTDPFEVADRLDAGESAMVEIPDHVGDQLIEMLRQHSILLLEARTDLSDADEVLLDRLRRSDIYPPQI